MHQKAVAVRPLTDRLNLLERINPAAAAIVRVLQTNQAGPNVVIVVRTDLIFELADVHDSVVAVNGPAGGGAKSCRTARFPGVDVASCFTEQFVARLRMSLDANLIGHGPGRN